MVVCPICGNQNPAEQPYCGSCGGRLGGATGLIKKDTILEGRYLIIKLVGRGGMGAVYKALDRRLQNRVVAIKEMSTGAVGQDNIALAVEAFEREVGMLINLDNPALPRVWDFFAGEQHRLYLVMDFIEGESLEAVLQRRGPVPEAEILDWARQICAVLHYLHSHQPPVIFRDLKPANIMLTPQGRIKLIDFGIARHFKPGQTTDTVTYGSVGFSAPEQYGQGQTDARSDIYSLGATLYYLITGINPSKNPFQFEPVSSLVGVTKPTERAIHLALQLNPADRPASVGEWLALLDAPGADKHIVDDTVLLSSDPELTVKLPHSDTGSDSTTMLPKPGFRANLKWVAGALAMALLLLAVWFGFAGDESFKQAVERETAAQLSSRSNNEPAPIEGTAIGDTTSPAVVEEVKPPAAKDKDKKQAKPKNNAVKKIQYQKYRNERFGYAIDYPRDFTAGVSPENGDGRVFSSPGEEAKLVVYGANVLQNESLADIYQVAKKYAGGKIAYQQMGNNWFVLSWEKDDIIYYLKTFAGRGSANSFIFTYPEAEKQYYDQITVHLESTFRPGDVNQIW
ncbi:Serine/threonine-protein kinase F [Sporotomaculum syntrophicum]|uniref:non-specific serine/threonine protein kinase n=2 Tax=Sporotomaculum syntrophicum TaxID=182264 RepID=A0A9D3AVI2_9FIRM|nr:Serine/threonine-protein kinase F [Sporotomaculum syntrophicum]